MEYLQYNVSNHNLGLNQLQVLNIVISGIPSIPLKNVLPLGDGLYGFKPCYKWNTFNTENLSS